MKSVRLMIRVDDFEVGVVFGAIVFSKKVADAEAILIASVPRLALTSPPEYKEQIPGIAATWLPSGVRVVVQYDIHTDKQHVKLDIDYIIQGDRHMRLTATDKAIGELNMRRADIARAQALIVKFGANVEVGINTDLADIDRCIELLRAVQPAPKPEKAAKVGKPRKGRKGGTEVEG